jgi:ankyrin repeat protein
LENATKTFPSDLLEYEDGAALIVDPGTWSKKMHHNSHAVLRSLVGHCVPVSLRRFLLKWRLFDSEDVKTTFNVMKRNVAIQRLKDATESALFTMISRTVPITFNNDLREYDSKDMREKAIVVLNQYFVTYSTQHASHVALVTPLLEIFDSQPPRGPVMVSMFNRLMSILPGNGPARAGSLAVAREAVKHLKFDDEELYLFLEGLLKKAIDQQTELRSMNLTYRDIAEFREIGTFLVPWVDTCFIGYLRKAAAAFIWDQCFLTGWDVQFPIFVSDVLRASRDDLLTVKNAYELQRIIKISGRNVRTKQLRKYFKQRAKDKSEANKLKRPQMDKFWAVPALTRLNDVHPEKASLKRIQRLLAMVGGAADVRKQREEEESLEVSKALESLNIAIEACTKGDASTLSTLLVNKSVTSDAVTQKSQSLLFIAAYNGHPKCVQTLLENKAPVDAGDHTVGISPLAGAVIGSNTRSGNVWKVVSERYRFVIRYLLDKGADPNYKCNRTIIRPREMISAAEHDEIENHRRPMGKLSIIGAGSTPLHIATACALLPGTRYFGCPEIILILRRHGGDASILNSENETSASLATDPSVPKAIKAALEVPTIDDKDVALINDLRQACAMGETAKFAKVISMAQKQSSKAFRCIINGVGGLESGFASSEMPPLQTWEVAAATPLALACAKGHGKIARALIEAGCDVNCGRPGPANPMVCAAQSLGKHGDPKNPKFTEIITRLIKAGAKDHTRSAETGQSALHIVASRGIKPLYQLLVKDAKSDELAKDFRGHVPKFLLAEATGEGVARDELHNIDVKDIPDMRANAKAREAVPKLNFAKTDVGEAVIEVILSQKLKLDLIVPPRISGVDEVVGTRDLILGDPRNLDKIDKLRIEAVQKTKNSDDAETLVTNAIDTAIIKKLPALKDDREDAFMKAKVKNNDGKPVLVKMRALNSTEKPEVALERAQIIVERLNLPANAASKLAKALVSYSKKKEKSQKVSTPRTYTQSNTEFPIIFYYSHLPSFRNAYSMKSYGYEILCNFYA